MREPLSRSLTPFPTIKARPADRVRRSDVRPVERFANIKKGCLKVPLKISGPTHRTRCGATGFSYLACLRD
jgi:hypothetical protein